MLNYKFGHIACALDRVQLGDGVILDPRDSISYTTGDGDVVITALAAVDEGSYVCMLVGAKPLCEEETQVLELVNTPDMIQIDSNFPVESTLTGTINDGGGAAVINPNIKFTMSPTPGAVNNMKITLTFDRASFPATIFKAMIAFPELVAGSCIWVTIFGDQVIEWEVPATSIYYFNPIHVVSNDLSMNQVVI